MAYDVGIDPLAEQVALPRCEPRFARRRRRRRRRAVPPLSEAQRSTARSSKASVVFCFGSLLAHHRVAAGLAIGTRLPSSSPLARDPCPCSTTSHAPTGGASADSSRRTAGTTTAPRGHGTCGWCATRWTSRFHSTNSSRAGCSSRATCSWTSSFSSSSSAAVRVSGFRRG